MNKKRILIILAVLLFALLTVTSCKGDIPAETTADTTPDTTAPEETDITVFSRGVCNYRIVYPADETDAEFNAARGLQALIEEKCGVKPELVRGTAAGGKNADPAVKEILLSFVDFDEFDDAIASVGYNYYVIKSVGNKIVVTGHEREGFEAAYDAFEAYIESNTADGEFTVPADLFLSDKAGNKDAKDFYEIPGYPGGMIEDICLLGDDHSQVTIYDTNAEMYETYGSKLEAEGYALYSENEIDGNLYSTYTRDDEMLYYYYCPNSNETRVIIAEDVNLPSLEAPSYTKVCEPAYISIAIHDDTGKVSGDAQGGIIRFADGSFLVYDGGNNNSYQAKHIYEVLVNNSLDPKNIVIRAWVFSHFHGDHIGAFQKFVSLYRSNPYLHIESFIYNFCDTQEQTQCISAGQMSKTESACKTMGADIPIYKCLTGQIYRFPGMDMEVLATMSDFIPRVIGFETSDAEKDAGDGNSMSIVVRLKTPAGNTCMLTGDSTNIVLDNMVDRYSAEYLDSDIVTTPHHAHNRNSYRARNATIKFYDAVKPDILVVTSTNMNKFTPTGSYPYEVNVHVIKTYDPEIYLMNEVRLINLSTLKEIK